VLLNQLAPIQLRIGQRSLFADEIESCMKHSFSVISDIDGVLHRGSKIIAGARRFASALGESGRKYLFLTNCPDHSPEELHKQLKKMGIEIPAECFYTAAQAIADFLVRHEKHPRVHVIGSRFLREEIRRKGSRITKLRPHFVVVAPTETFNRDDIDEAIGLIQKGANFITTNKDPYDLTASSVRAGNGALISPIEKVAGCHAYVVGKPNHLMIRGAAEKFGIDCKRTLMIGDSLDTDIDVGIQSQMTTVLLLSGVTSRHDLKRSAYQPDYVFKSIANLHLNKLP
jgi:NagD protein